MLWVEAELGTFAQLCQVKHLLRIWICSLSIVAVAAGLRGAEACGRPSKQVILEAVTGEGCTYEHGCLVCPTEGAQDDWLVIEEWNTYRDRQGRFLCGKVSNHNESTFHKQEAKTPATFEHSVTLGTLRAGLGKPALARRAGARSRERSIVAVHRVESSLYILDIAYGRLGLEYINFDDGMRVEGGTIATFDISEQSPHSSSPNSVITTIPRIARASITVEGGTCIVKLEYSPSEHIKNKGLEKVIPLSRAQRPLTQAELAKRRLRYERKGHGGSLILHLSDLKACGNGRSYELLTIVADETGKPEFVDSIRGEKTGSESTLQDSYRDFQRTLELGDVLLTDSGALVVYPIEGGGVTLEQYCQRYGRSKPIGTYWYVGDRLIAIKGRSSPGRDSPGGQKRDIVKAHFDRLKSGDVKLICEAKDGSVADLILDHE